MFAKKPTGNVAEKRVGNFHRTNDCIFLGQNRFDQGDALLYIWYLLYTSAESKRSCSVLAERNRLNCPYIYAALIF